MKTTTEVLKKVDLWGQQKNRPIWIPENFEPKVVPEDGWVLETVQQVKSEVSELLDVILANGQFGIALEVGLGRYGGSSIIWREIFDKVISIEYSHERIQNFISREGTLDGKHMLICGSSQSRQVFEKVKDEQLDFLFIDGAHSYNGVRGDYENFARLVKPNGIIAFHDVVEDPRQPMLEVFMFLKELSEGFIDSKVHNIQYIVNSKIGCAFEII